MIFSPTDSADVWITHRGEVVSISSLNDAHLINILALLVRKAPEAVVCLGRGRGDYNDLREMSNSPKLAARIHTLRSVYPRFVYLQEEAVRRELIWEDLAQLRLDNHLGK